MKHLYSSFLLARYLGLLRGFCSLCGWEIAANQVASPDRFLLHVCISFHVRYRWSVGRLSLSGSWQQQLQTCESEIRNRQFRDTFIRSIQEILHGWCSRMSRLAADEQARVWNCSLPVPRTTCSSTGDTSSAQHCPHQRELYLHIAAAESFRTTVVYQDHAILRVLYHRGLPWAFCRACGLPGSRRGGDLCNPQGWLGGSHEFQLDLLEIWPPSFHSVGWP